MTPEMTLLVQLSDLHMAHDPTPQSALFEQLVQTLRQERATLPTGRVAIVLTGDVFDSATQPAAKAVGDFLALHARMVDALGGDAPTIVLPGNHDRRSLGLLGPNRAKLFRTLLEAADPTRVHVAGARHPTSRRSLLRRCTACRCTSSHTTPRTYRVAWWERVERFGSKTSSWRTRGSPTMVGPFSY